MYSLIDFIVVAITHSLPFQVHKHLFISDSILFYA